jgi:hypothetical protein
VRLAEVLAALSLATDAGNGFPREKSLRNAVIAVRLAARAGHIHPRRGPGELLAFGRVLHPDEGRSRWRNKERR